MGLIAQSDAVRRRQRQLAENRSLMYGDLLGINGEPFSILEVGCGSGGLGVAFASLGHAYLGIDIDYRVVEEGQRVGANVRLLDLMDLPEGESFDVVFFSQVLEHITEPHVFLGKARQHMKPGAVLHLDVPNQGTLAGWPSRTSRDVRDRWGAIEYPHHCMAYSKQSLAYALSQVPGLRSQVFAAACDDGIWGQAIDWGLPAGVFYRVSAALRAESLLVGLGRAAD